MIKHTIMDSRKIIPQIFQRGFSTGEVIQPPISVEIQPTNVCNYNCNFCSYAVRRQNREHLSASALQKLCVDIAGMDVKSVYFAGGGEPTLHPDIFPNISFLHERGIKVALLSNGSNERVIKSLSRYLSYILVNIASADCKTYEEIMGVKPKKVFELPTVIKEMSSSPPLIGARVVVTEENILTTAKTARFLYNCGFDYLIITPAADYEDTGIALRLQGSRKLRSIYESLEDELPGFVKWGQKITSYVPVEKCWSIYNDLHAIVAATGHVYLCVPDIGNKELAIGNIFEKSFAEIWAGDRHRDIVGKLNTRYKGGNCSNCRFIKYNNYLNDIEVGMSSIHQEFI